MGLNIKMRDTETNQRSPGLSVKSASRRSVSFIIIILISLNVSSGFADLGQLYRDAEKLSSQEKLLQVKASLNTMQETLRFTLSELRSSYEDKDVIQTNCIKDKLSTIKGLLRISEEAEINLSEAVVTGQVEVVNTEYVKINMALERVRDLRSQVANCAKDVNDPLLNKNRQTSTPEITDKSVQAFEPTDSDEAIIIYEPISSERPEAISPSE